MGELGEIVKIVVEYPQGWLSKPIDQEGQKQASWRTDPEEAGAAGCLGDIGTHAENLARYISGLEIDELCAEFTSFVKGRQLDDDANLLLRYRGARRESCLLRRFLLERKTPSKSGFTARRPRSSGTRKILTTLL